MSGLLLNNGHGHVEGKITAEENLFYAWLRVQIEDGEYTRTQSEHRVCATRREAFGWFAHEVESRGFDGIYLHGGR
jgi:hypothetical protein